MVIRDCDNYYGYREFIFYPSYELSMVQMHIDYWFNLWEIIEIFIRNPIGIKLTGDIRCEKELDYD